MINIAKSIVGKLWVTILLLVSFVLFIFTVFMLEFLENYHKQQTEVALTQTGNAIATIVEKYKEEDSPVDAIERILTEHTNAIVASTPYDIELTVQEGDYSEEIARAIIDNEKFASIFEAKEPILAEMILPSQKTADQLENYIVLAFPLETENDFHGAVYIYQSPEVLDAATAQTTQIVFIAAIIAFILTTFFAFFLSSRITLPLRKMREQAFEMSKGRFDTELQTTQSDEIGQLGVAFNQMGRQLKHHLEVINQEKEQLSSILSSMSDAVITFNRDRTILVINPPAEKLLQTWYIRKTNEVEKPIPNEIYHMLDHVLDLEDEINEQLEMDNHYYSITISPLYSGNSVRGAVAVIRDKTESSRLEKLKSDFIANVSHELRTPIAMLQGYSEAILDGIVETEEDRNEMIQIIYDESQRMGRLVTDLLDLARMENGHLQLFKDEVAIIPTLDRMTHKFYQAGKEKKVDVVFESKLDEALTVEIDEDRIEQVVTNLIDNAIRYTPENGEVRLVADQELGYVKVTIKDSGQGIPKEDLPYVFERFYKADKARTRKKGGTGLGLAITKNIIEAHGGNIKVESEVGNGTSFTFYLPL